MIIAVTGLYSTSIFLVETILLIVTRSPLVDDILSVRETYNSIDSDKKRSNPSSDLTACPVRKHAEAFNDDTIGRRVRIRRSTNRQQPQSPATPTPASVPSRTQLYAHLAYMPNPVLFLKSGAVFFDFIFD